jgi:hypothetical protein
MISLFTKHPNEVNETYFEHARFAFCCGCKLLLLGMVALTHAFFPFLFTETVGKQLEKLRKCFEQRKKN